jgi:hypothetical protein
VSSYALMPLTPDDDEFTVVALFDARYCDTQWAITVSDTKAGTDGSQYD